MEDKKKRRVKSIIVGLALIPLTAVVFACIPTLIADKVSSARAKKYGRI